MKTLHERSDLVLYEITGGAEQVAGAFCDPESLRPLLNIVALALAQGANRLVVESGYIDFAYRAEYAFYYGGLFKDYGGSTQRILFFRSDLLTLDGLLASKETECLGYGVLRPTKEGRVGRTVVPMGIADPNVDALQCEGIFSVHLWGRSFAVRGFPFVQQDTQVMRCAQASLFSCMLFLQNAGGKPLSLPHEISEVATREFAQLGRPFPSVGLTIEEITTFLHRVGYEPLLFVKQPRDQFGFDPDEWVSYAGSGIPSIITTENHALAVHGSILDLTRPLVRPIVRYQSLVAAAIVQDDGRGPYSVLVRDLPAIDSLPERAKANLIEAPISTVVTNAQGVQEIDKKTRAWTFDDLHSITVPCPRKMHLRASEALELTERLLQSVPAADLFSATLEGVTSAEILTKVLLDPLELPKGSRLEDACVLNAWLTKSHRLKELATLRIDASQGSADSLQPLVEMRMPRLVWVVEITTVGLLKKGRDIVGEVVLDATGVASDNPILYFHLPGIVVRGEGKDSDTYFLDEDAPYPSWRSSLP